MSDRCAGARRDGSVCRGKARSSGYCFAHDPELQAVRAQGQRKGGHARSKLVRVRRIMPSHLSTIFDQLENALAETHDGDLQPRVATAMDSLASAMCRVLESGELASRVEDLERRVGGDKKWA